MKFWTDRKKYKIPKDNRGLDWGYRFCYINITSVGTIEREQSFVKLVKTRNDITKEIVDYLDCLKNDFWLKYRGCRHTLIGWEPAENADDSDWRQTVYCDTVSSTEKIEAEHAYYETKLHEFTFTEIMMLYQDMCELPQDARHADRALSEAFKVVIYQYVSCAWFWRRWQMRKLLGDAETGIGRQMPQQMFELRFPNIRRSYRTLVDSNWKVDGAKFHANVALQRMMGHMKNGVKKKPITKQQAQKVIGGYNQGVRKRLKRNIR